MHIQILLQSGLETLRSLFNKNQTKKRILKETDSLAKVQFVIDSCHLASQSN